MKLHTVIHRLLFWTLLLLGVSGQTSCTRMAENARKKIHVERVAKIRPIGSRHLGIWLDISNQTRHKLVLKEAEIEIFTSGRKLGVLHLREKVEVLKRSSGLVKSIWEIKVHNPMAIIHLMTHLKEQEGSPLSFSIHGRGRGGPISFNFSKENLSLYQILAYL